MQTVHRIGPAGAGREAGGVKRGLVVLDPAETPAAEWAGRVARLQERLQREGLQAALLYGDVYRSGDLSYLTNVCIYWNEGLLVVPARGEPAFLAKLSARVHPWMRSTGTLTDLRSGGNLAQLVADYLEGYPTGAVGLVEMDWWPAPLVTELAQRVPGQLWRDLGPAVRRARWQPSAAEVALLRRGAGISAAAIKPALQPGLPAAECVGRAERAARGAGVEDLFAWSAQGPDGALSLDVVSEYRGYWTRAARLLLPGGAAPAWSEKLAAAHGAAAARLAAGVVPEQLQSAAAAHLAGLPVAGSWQVECLHHTDLETGGGYRYPDERDLPLPDGAVVSLSVSLRFDQGQRAVVADTYLVRGTGAECLTGGLPGPVLGREGG